MKARVSPARSAAFGVLTRVATRDSYAAELLHSNLLDELSPADRALTTELVMGVLRWQQLLDSELGNAGKKSIAKFDTEVKVALRLGAYQLRFLDRIPARAAVNESVELVKVHGKRSAAPLVNAVLRKVSADGRHVLGESASAEKIAQAYSHPLWLVERWAKAYGLASAHRICEYNQERPTTTIRATTAFDSVEAELKREGIEIKPSSIVTKASRIVNGDVTATTLYREGGIAIQDEGSQLVGLLARGKRILDCCAAPGGKSALAAERNRAALVVSMDLHLHRARLMRQLIRSNSVLVGDARQLPLQSKFDCVIADLPCTGTGTLARNPEIKWRVKPEDLARLQNLQLEILGSVAGVTRQIVFSTCSIEQEEGEGVVEEFLKRHPEFRAMPIAETLQQLVDDGELRPEGLPNAARGRYLRTIPGMHNCDGFFAAILAR